MYIKWIAFSSFIVDIEEKGKQIDMLFEYYNNLEEVFSSSVYPSPYELLLLNILPL